VTAQLVAAGYIPGLDVGDRVIIDHGCYASVAEDGLLGCRGQRFCIIELHPGGIPRGVRRITTWFPILSGSIRRPRPGVPLAVASLRHYKPTMCGTCKETRSNRHLTGVRERRTDRRW
jgi:hypothetical protein